MKTTLIATACLFLLTIATAQQQPASKSTNGAPSLEPNVRKLWADFKAKNKPALAAELADSFREMEEGGSGFGDKKAEIASVDEFDLQSYTLKDFTVKPLGAHTALVTYTAHYEGKSGGQMSKSDSIFGEVWVHEANDWKALYIQETTVK